MLALAHHIEDLVGRGILRDYTDAARRLGRTRARLSQILDLVLLAPSIQEALLRGDLRVAERSLREVVRLPSWDDQAVAHQVG